MLSRGNSELAYLLQREAEERACAATATEAAKPLHTRLADSYAERISERMGERRFERAKQREK